jgi:hypothetical protein
MRISYLLLIILIIVGCSCSKEDLSSNNNLDINVEPIGISRSTPTAGSIYNPIVGRWELGAFKILCLGVKDTTIYLNERGDFIEFRKTDTAYYTYNTTNATGWSPYKILDSSTFILNGDTMRIIANDGVRLTTYLKALNGGNQQWMTYKKATN